jgi:hypothetical protein
MDRLWITGCTGFTTDHQKGSRISWHFFGQDTLRMKKYYACVVDASITPKGL